MKYIIWLDKFDGADIASICVSEGLYEEAFVIYKKFDDKKAAMAVLRENLKVLDPLPHTTLIPTTLLP